MKLHEISSDELQIKQSGFTGVIVGTIITIAGIGGVIWPFVGTVDKVWALVGLGLIVAGALTAFFAKSRTVTLRKTGTSEIVTAKVLTRQSSTESFASDQVASVGLDSSTHLETSSGSDSSSTKRVRKSVLYVALKDNNQVVLATKSTDSNSGVSVAGVNLSSYGKQPLAEEADRIAKFFDVPLASNDAGMVGAVDLNQVIGAVKGSFAGKSKDDPES